MDAVDFNTQGATMIQEDSVEQVTPEPQAF